MRSAKKWSIPEAEADALRKHPDCEWASTEITFDGSRGRYTYTVKCWTKGKGLKYHDKPKYTESGYPPQLDR